MSLIYITNIFTWLFSDNINYVIAVVLSVAIIIAAYTYYRFGLRQFLLNKCYQDETWLPVSDDTGNIIGRVAQSVSIENPGKFQHPIIRVIVWCNGKIYLKPRSKDLLFERGKVDIPFEVILRFGKSIESSLDEIHEKYLPNGDKPRFLLKYSYDNPEGKWQVLLYYINVDDVSKLNTLSLTEGKIWPMKHVMDNLGKTYFSNIMENELKFTSVLIEKY